MTVQELITELLKVQDKEKTIVLGVEGYTNEDLCECGAYDTEKAFYIVDGCFYQEIDG